MEEGFSKGSSDNLPVVNADMVDDYYRRNLDFFVAEVRNVKTKRACRESYGDNAVGYVQLKREGPLCTIKAKLTPEHKVHNKSYNVIVIIDEALECITTCKCTDCAASAGGCKHGVAFLFWLHRRSEEPSVTSTSCYWKASRLSRVVKGRKGLDLASLVGHDLPPLEKKGGDFLRAIVNENEGARGGLFDFFKEDPYEDASIHHLALKYAEVTDEDLCPDMCIAYMKSKMTDSICSQIEAATREQGDSPMWHQMRFGRITASKMYEASRCKTAGALKEAILGASPVLKTAPVIRGQILEPEVLMEVSRRKNINIKRVGLILDPKYPIFGASPDGISEEFVVEVKCPSKDSTVASYVAGGKIKEKYFSQINMQMFFAQKSKGLFCVASPMFELNKEVEIHQVDFDGEKCQLYLEHASNFWKHFIFPCLK